MTVPSNPSKVWWEGIVEQGSVVYVPRGWWHDVSGIAEPSMHLTVGADPLTGVDYLAWLTDQLRLYPLWRTELPRFSGNLDDHMKLLGDSLLTALPNNTLNDFLQSRAEGRTKLPKYALPYAVDSCDWLIPNDKIIKKVNHFLSYVSTNDRLILRANNKEVELALVTEPLLKQLASSNGITLSELDVAIPDLSAEEIRMVVTALIQQNILYID